MNNKIEIIVDPSFANLNFVEHGFFTRTGGVSEGVYASLNCSYFQEDKKVVRENRQLAMSHINRSLSQLVLFTDCYSNKTIIVDQPWGAEETIHADAMVTQNRSIVLGALSADCPVILFADHDKKVIGIAHAGWRSARAGIIESCVHTMFSLGVSPGNLSAVISPCITQPSYEVDSEFYKQIISDSPMNSEYFNSSANKDHYMFDLRMYVYKKLINLGIEQVSFVDIDTYQDEARFFSCRRAYHKKERGHGCQLSFIHFA